VAQHLLHLANVHSVLLGVLGEAVTEQVPMDARDTGPLPKPPHHRVRTHAETMRSARLIGGALV